MSTLTLNASWSAVLASALIDRYELRFRNGLMKLIITCRVELSSDEDSIWIDEPTLRDMTPDEVQDFVDEIKWEALEEGVWTWERA